MDIISYKMLKIEEKRQSIERKSSIREFVFGIQDGLISTVGLLSGVQSATSDNRIVLLTGFTAMLSGAISMSAGSYLSSKAEKEIFDSELEKETKFVEEVPYLAQESLLSALEKEGTSRETSYRIVKLLHNEKSVFVKTFQEKVLGLGTADISNPIKGALVMAFSFILGALIPMLPYFFIHGDFALILSVGLSTFTLFGVGAFKGYLANKNIFLSGLEFFAIALGASAFGYLIGILIEFLYKVKLPTV